MKQKFTILPPAFYDREPATVAEELLGTLLVRRFEGETLVGTIVETEAYLPFGDPASHSFRGKTKRNESMFKAAGHAYVHRMRHHTLFNVVTEGPDIPGGVLIRGVEPLEGIETSFAMSPTNGPGKICRAFHITHALDGIALTNPLSELFLAEDPLPHTFRTITTTRIGITKGAELPLRFYVHQNPHVSKRAAEE